MTRKISPAAARLAAADAAFDAAVAQNPAARFVLVDWSGGRSEARYVTSYVRGDRDYARAAVDFGYGPDGRKLV